MTARLARRSGNGTSAHARARSWTATSWLPHDRRVDEPQQLHGNRYWRLAVWALRIGYVALAVALVGLIVLVSTSTPWVLAIGVIGWLGAAAVTVTGVLRARHELSDPRPGLWPMRFMLIHDTVHARSSPQAF